MSYDLIPLTSEQPRLCSSVVADEKGISDLQNGLDSPAAGDEPGIRLINPKRTMALLTSRLQAGASASTRR